MLIFIKMELMKMDVKCKFYSTKGAYPQIACRALKPLPYFRNKLKIRERVIFYMQYHYNRGNHSPRGTVSGLT